MTALTTTTTTTVAPEADRMSLAGAAAGVGFAVLGIASGVLAPVAPASDATAAKVRAWILDHHAGLNVATILVLSGPMILLVFFAAFRRQFRDAGLGALFFAFGLLTVAIAFAGAMFQAVLVHGGANLSDDAMLALFRTWRTMFYAAPAITSTGYLLTAAIGLRSSNVPRWLSPAAVVVAAAGLASGIVTASTANGGPSAIGFVGFLLNLAWVVGAAISLTSSHQHHEERRFVGA